MQINIDAIKNTAYDLSLNRTKASLPTICPTLTGPFIVGGVLGRVKAYNPITTDVIMDMVKMALLSPQPMKPIQLVTAIQAMVPISRMRGNCFSGAVIWRIEIELVKAIVGANVRQYNSIVQ